MKRLESRDQKIQYFTLFGHHLVRRRTGMLAFLLFSRLSVQSPVYVMSDDGTLNISGDGVIEKSETQAFMYKASAVIIGAGITAIGKESFRDFSYLKSAEFESNSQLVTIDDYGFYGAKISNIELPSSVTRLGNSCFALLSSYYSNTLSIKLSSNLKEIGDLCFNYVKMEELTIPDSVISIGIGAFKGSTITTFSFGSNSSLTSLNDSVFESFTTTSSIVIPSSVRIIGNNVFKSSGISYIYFDDGS